MHALKRGLKFQRNTHVILDDNWLKFIKKISHWFTQNQNFETWNLTYNIFIIYFFLSLFQDFKHQKEIINYSGSKERKLNNFFFFLRNNQGPKFLRKVGLRPIPRLFLEVPLSNFGLLEGSGREEDCLRIHIKNCLRIDLFSSLNE